MSSYQFPGNPQTLPGKAPVGFAPPGFLQKLYKLQSGNAPIKVSRPALVGGRWNSRISFMIHNQPVAINVSVASQLVREGVRYANKQVGRVVSFGGIAEPEESDPTGLWGPTVFGDNIRAVKNTSGGGEVQSGSMASYAQTPWGGNANPYFNPAADPYAYFNQGGGAFQPAYNPQWAAYPQPNQNYAYGQQWGQPAPWQQWQQYGGDSGWQSAGQDDFGGIWESMDPVMNVIGDIASNPIVAGVISAIPYGALVVAGVNATVGAYKVTRQFTSKKLKAKQAQIAKLKKQAEQAQANGGSDIQAQAQADAEMQKLAKQEKALKQLLTDAKKKKPEAIKAAKQIKIIAKADKVRKLALKGDRAALKYMVRVRQGVAKGDPQAFEAYAMFDALQQKMGLPNQVYPTAAQVLQARPPAFTDYTLDEEDDFDDESVDASNDDEGDDGGPWGDGDMYDYGGYEEFAGDFSSQAPALRREFAPGKFGNTLETYYDADNGWDSMGEDVTSQILNQAGTAIQTVMAPAVQALMAFYDMLLAKTGSGPELGLPGAGGKALYTPEQRAKLNRTSIGRQMLALYDRAILKSQQGAAPSMPGAPKAPFTGFTPEQRAKLNRTAIGRQALAIYDRAQAGGFKKSTGLPGGGGASSFLNSLPKPPAAGTYGIPANYGIPQGQGPGYGAPQGFSFSF